MRIFSALKSGAFLALSALAAVSTGCPQPGIECEAIAILTAPESVAFGAQFTLSGEDSVAPEGSTIRRWFWTNLEATQITNLPVGVTIATDVPQIPIQFSEDAPLPPGSYVFALFVQTDQGVDSAPVTATVRVLPGERPVAVLTAPATVEAGVGFQLDATLSSASMGAELVTFRWTQVETSVTTETAVPTLDVSGSAPGSLTFELVVVDSFGQESEPAQAEVFVLDTTRPTGFFRRR